MLSNASVSTCREVFQVYKPGFHSEIFLIAVAVVAVAASHSAVISVVTTAAAVVTVGDGDDGGGFSLSLFYRNAQFSICFRQTTNRYHKLLSNSGRAISCELTFLRCYSFIFCIFYL